MQLKLEEKRRKKIRGRTLGEGKSGLEKMYKGDRGGVTYSGSKK